MPYTSMVSIGLTAVMHPLVGMVKIAANFQFETLFFPK